MQRMDGNEWKIDFIADQIDVDFKNNFLRLCRCRELESTYQACIKKLQKVVQMVYSKGTIPPDQSDAALSYEDDGCGPHLMWMINELLFTLLLVGKVYIKWC